MQASAGGGWLPAERLPGSDDPPAAPPASVEGGPRRCFRQLLVCPRGFNTSTTGWPLHSLGQHLARHYAPQLPALPPPPLPPPQRAGRAAATPGSGSERVLSVIFQRRVSADRQLLNSAELVARCNKWQSTTSAGRRVRAACQEVRWMWGSQVRCPHTHAYTAASCCPTRRACLSRASSPPSDAPVAHPEIVLRACISSAPPARWRWVTC